MKQLVYLLLSVLILSSCNDLANNPPQFVEIGNAKRVYQVFNEDGTPKMVADSIYNKAGVKIALAGTTRNVMLIKADSAASLLLKADLMIPHIQSVDRIH